MLNMLKRKSKVVEEPQYHSKFGGLWTDRSDALEELDRRVKSGQVSKDDQEQIRFWIEKGYIVLKNAVPHEVCEQVKNDIDRAWSEGDSRLRIQEPGDPEGVPLSNDAPISRMRVVDIYAYYESARKALFAKPIVDFLSTVFEDSPLLFQSLSFYQGSQQGMHQDTAYVVVSSPVELAATWIALEDIQPGSGELQYYSGSHKLPEFLFSDEFKHWNPGRDGDAQHEQWANEINENANRLGMERETFLPKQGDVLIWAADLAHGGSPVTNPELSRKSLVGHYCPNHVDPNYYSFKPERNVKKESDGAFFSSYYYEL